MRKFVIVGILLVAAYLYYRWRKAQAAAALQPVVGAAGSAASALAAAGTTVASGVRSAFGGQAAATTPKPALNGGGGIGGLFDWVKAQFSPPRSSSSPSRGASPRPPSTVPQVSVPAADGYCYDGLQSVPCGDKLNG